MTQLASSLAELVAALTDGAAFYERAAAKVSDRALVDLFERMGRLKRSIADEINAEIAHAGETPREGGSVFGTMRRLYADVLASLDDGNAGVYVARLEDEEDRALAAFREAVLGGDSARVRELALRLYPEIEAMHAEMSRLKKALA
jgi:uncharacterized protein (TIGR02284 family)